MALTTCKHCGKPVSDRAVKCPHCGCNPKEEAKAEPVDQHIEEAETPVEQPTSPSTKAGERSNKTLAIAVIISIVVIIICLIGYLTLNHGSSPTTDGIDTVATDMDVVDYNMTDSVADEEELKHTTLSDLVRMNLNGKIKEITFTRYDPGEDPNEQGYGYQIWTSKFDQQGMLTSCSNETPKENNGGTIYFRNGIITRRTTEFRNYAYEYRQTDTYTLDVIQTNDSDDLEELVMVLTFGENGKLTKKEIIDSALDPYAYAAAYDYAEANFIVNYNTDGVEIDNKDFWGNLTNEEKDGHGNWTKRTYNNSLTFTRVIEYYE